MTEVWQSSDDFAWIVAMATPGQQPQPQVQLQQTPIQQHFTQNSVNGVIPWPEWQVAPEAVSTNPPIQYQPQPQPIQPAPIQVQPAPVNEPIVQPEPPVPAKPAFDLNSEINGLLKEFGLEPNAGTDNQPLPADNQQWADTTKDDPNTKESIAKEEKFNILLEKVVTDRDLIKDQLWQERYEKEQYKIAAEKLQSKLSEVIEQKTALEYDENKLQVNDDIKDFVHFYNKRTKEKDQQTPDSVLTKRTLAEAVKIVEAITNVNLDQYISQYYLASNPQIPKIWQNHYFPDQMNFDPSRPQERTIEQKKADPKWNPMEDRF